MEGLLNQLVLEHLQLAPLLWGEYCPSPLGARASAQNSRARVGCCVPRSSGIRAGRGACRGLQGTGRGGQLTVAWTSASLPSSVRGRPVSTALGPGCCPLSSGVVTMRTCARVPLLRNPRPPWWHLWCLRGCGFCRSLCSSSDGVVGGSQGRFLLSAG